MNVKHLWGGLALVALAIGSLTATAAEQPAATNVDLFAAIAAGQIEVKLIPNDATVANIIVTNRSGKHLRVMLPEAFAGRQVVKPAKVGALLPAVDAAILANRPLVAPVGKSGEVATIRLPEGYAGLPILAQAAGFGGAGIGGNQGFGGGGNQGFGGGFGGQQGGFGGGGVGGAGGGGFFNIAPEKVVKGKVAVVCLQHGKPDPNPRVPYEIVPVSAVTDKPGVSEMLGMLGRGEISQNTAQAAAWHVMDGLTWQELANKVRVKHLNGTSEMWFQPQELFQANQVVAAAQKLAASRPAPVTPVSPGEQTPTSAKP